MNTQKLAEIFSDKFHMMANCLWEKMRPKDWAGAFEQALDEVWTEYLNGIDCTVITRDDIRDDFEGVIHSAQGMVCVANAGDERTQYILVPKELAEKALVLGGLPERWFPETSKT
mgnify:CR=1 FL=1